MTPGRPPSEEPVGDLADQLVADVVSEVSLTALKPFRSMIMTASSARRGAGVQQLGRCLVDQLRPVRKTGQRVVQRVVTQPADEHLVVQRDRGVVGDGLQQLQSPEEKPRTSPSRSWTAIAPTIRPS